MITDLFKIVLLTFTLVFVSCFGDLDIDQAGDVGLEPVIVMPLVNYEFNQLDVIEIDLNSLPPVNDIILLPQLINVDEIEENLESMVFQFKGTNTFNGNVTINLQLLDELGDVQYEFSEMIINEDDTDFLFEEEIDFFEAPKVLRAYAMSFSFVYDGAITASDPGILNFQSAGIFYLNIN